jgi:hypothetical protein
MFKSSVRIFGFSHMDILPVDLIAKMKFCFVAETDFYQKWFIFYSMVYHCHANSKHVTLVCGVMC